MPVHRLGAALHEDSLVEGGGEGLHAAPLRPGDVHHKGQPIGDFLLDAEGDALGHLELELCAVPVAAADSDGSRDVVELGVQVHLV